jgi:hypothetical protein
MEREQIGLRVPANVKTRIIEKSGTIGVSQNDVVLMLINIGLTVMDNGFMLPAQAEPPHAQLHKP